MRGGDTQCSPTAQCLPTSSQASASQSSLSLRTSWRRMSLGKENVKQSRTNTIRLTCGRCDEPLRYLRRGTLTCACYHSSLAYGRATSASYAHRNVNGSLRYILPIYHLSNSSLSLIISKPCTTNHVLSHVSSAFHQYTPDCTYFCRLPL